MAHQAGGNCSMAKQSAPDHPTERPVERAALLQYIAGTCEHAASLRQD